MKPIGELQIADSHFLGFCYQAIKTKEEVVSIQQRLKKEYPKAAHIPVVWEKFWDEDGEPPHSTGPSILKEIQSNQNDTKGIAIAIVRFWGNQLLGVTCGRLSACYGSIARLTLHRHFAANLEPMELSFTNGDKCIYGLGAGDCELILNVVTEDAATREGLANKLKAELNFDGFLGAQGEELPRLQNLQADLTQDCIPIYRYPGNYSGDEWKTFEWSTTSLMIKGKVEERLLIPQKMNHCVTNYYRDGNDFIAHHSDKDLDLNREGSIVSVSLGDERILELKRRKDPKDVTRILLPHFSMLVLGPITNQQFSHSILKKEGSIVPRISLTMREVKTFKDLKSGRLFGQGVKNKSLDQIRSWQRRENAFFWSVSGFFLATLVSKRSSGTNKNDGNGLFISAGLLILGGTFSWKMLSPMWYRRHEEQKARQFFSKTSLSGTKY